MINLPRSIFSISKITFNDLEILQNNLKSLLLNPKNKEKRKRNFANFFFQRIYSQTSCVDFFSKDVVNLVLFTKKIARILKEDKLTIEIFFLALCLNPNNDFSDLLKKYGVLKRQIIKQYLRDKKYSKISKSCLLSFETQILKLIQPTLLQQSFDKIFTFFFLPLLVLNQFCVNILSVLNKNFTSKISFPLLNVIFKFFFYKRSLKDIEISDECCTFFENLMYFAKIKYKTPVITNELLALAFLDSKYGSFLKLLLTDINNFYEIKYSLSKNLYEQEILIKEEIPKNLQYFSYLLKSGYFEKDFQALVTKENVLVKGNLTLKTSLIRNFTLQKIFKASIFEILEEEIFQSIFISSKNRTYKYT